ncbi:hypothetical protein [Nocardia sp. SC052]|uniref:hypothetical protein n=1 Tax=Nocardia sichangensis TaxID=3385975 RepID=UPI00399FA3F7
MPGPRAHVGDRVEPQCNSAALAPLVVARDPSSDGLRLLLSSGGAPLRGECGAAVAAYRGVSGLDIVPPDL